MGYSLDQTSLFQREDHLVYGRRGNSEILLHIGFGWGTLMDLGVIVDEGKILPLQRRVFCVAFETGAHAQQFFAF